MNFLSSQNPIFARSAHKMIHFGHVIRNPLYFCNLIVTQCVAFFIAELNLEKMGQNRENKSRKNNFCNNSFP